MGVKKSTVWTSANSSERRYTPASSLVANPTSTLGSTCRGSRVSTLSSTAGPSLPAQPAALLASVSRGFLASAVSLATLSPPSGFAHYTRSPPLVAPFPAARVAQDGRRPSCGSFWTSRGEPAATRATAAVLLAAGQGRRGRSRLSA